MDGNLGLLELFYHRCLKFIADFMDLCQRHLFRHFDMKFDKTVIAGFPGLQPVKFDMETGYDLF